MGTRSGGHCLWVLDRELYLVGNREPLRASELERDRLQNTEASLLRLD